MYNRILFIGFRCTGKTTISKEVANILGFGLVDTDTMIEKEYGRSINQITKNGTNWVDFRRIETLKIKELLNFDNMVISAGGGVGVNDVPYNSVLTFGDVQREIIKKSLDTLKILLVADEDVIRKRLYSVGMERLPDLHGKDRSVDEYIENNIQIMNKREEYYREMADLVFDTNGDVLENVNKIIDAIKNIKNL
ncbi:MAG: hypothetical protein IJ853_02320 [Rickettsiales bacterium]|nr:hypothetical protein [Rickettsiales bacterium]